MKKELRALYDDLRVMGEIKLGAYETGVFACGIGTDFSGQNDCLKGVHRI